MNGSAQGTAANPHVFKMHITQSIFMAFFAFLLAVKARLADVPKMRLLFALAALLAVYNILFMVQGRTGYVVLVALTAYFCFDWLGRKGLAVAVAVCLVTGVAGYYAPGPMQQRIKLATTEVEMWQPGKGAMNSNSSGLRLDYYTNSLSIIRDHPLFGVGTGGFEKAYDEKVRNTAMASSNNPHNQYLLITVQLGVLGLGLLLYLFYTQWRMAGLLPTVLEQNLARGVLLTIASGSLLNSLLLDHSEGLFFAWASGVLFAGLNVARQRSGEAN
jgi:O-antigen ligase